MQKNSTLVKRAESRSYLTNSQAIDCALQPKQETLQKIMQFASAYRSERIVGERFSDICLN